MRSVTAPRRIFRPALVLVVCLLLPACGKGKVNQENFDKVTNGMTLKEVEAILGRGTKDESGDGAGIPAQFGIDVGVSNPQRNKTGEVYVWEARDKKIKVFLLDGKVTNKLKEGF
jgi:hypothetical protein